MRWIMVFVLFSACAGCALPYRPQIQTAYTYYEPVGDGQWTARNVCVGMSGSDVIALLGPPIASAHGHSCRMYHRFDGIWPGLRTSELAFARDDDMVVVWLESNAVLAVGVLAGELGKPPSRAP